MKDHTLCETCMYNLKVKSKRVEYFCKHPYFKIEVKDNEERCRFYVNKEKNN